MVSLTGVTDGPLATTGGEAAPWGRIGGVVSMALVCLVGLLPLAPLVQASSQPTPVQLLSNPLPDLIGVSPRDSERLSIREGNLKGFVLDPGSASPQGDFGKADILHRDGFRDPVLAYGSHDAGHDSDVLVHCLRGLLGGVLSLSDCKVPSGRGPNRDLVYDPKRAPIIFLPGLLASELGCGPPFLAPLNLWPGVATDLRDWSVPFADLALINTRNRRGRITSRTTSSDTYPHGCGQMPFGQGRVAIHEPTPLSPLWCLPEDQADPDRPQFPCPLPFATDSYANFGAQLEAQIKQKGRGQIFLPWAWDWRLSPQAQAQALHQAIVTVTAETGIKATVVAHSFGNLLFREWVRYAESRGHQAGHFAGRFLSVAGPWWGVATAWTHPAYGALQPGPQAALLSKLIGTEHIMTVFQSSPGIYWLLPTKLYDRYITQKATTQGEHWLAVPRRFQRGSQWVRFRGIGRIVGSAFDLCPQSEQFPCLSQSLYRGAARGAGNPAFDRSGIRDFVAIVGSGIETPLQICHGCERWPDGREDGELVLVDGAGAAVTPHRIRKINGDTNVPLFSAIQGDDPTNPLGDKVDFFFTCGITHTGLMSVNEVVSRTVPFLTGDASLTYDGVFLPIPCQLVQPDSP